MAEAVPDGAQAEVLSMHGRALHLLRFGPEGAPPVLCLHGWLDNAHSFVPLARALPDQHLIAVDLPGHGRSDHRPAGVSYHQLDWVVDAIEVADALGLSRFALLGHSMGAGIAVLMAGTVPERIRALVMIEGIGPRPTPTHLVPDALRRHLQARAAHAATPSGTRGGALQTAVRARMAFSAPLSEAAASLLCQRGVRPAERGVAFAHDRRLQRPLPTELSEAHVRAFFQNVACPTLLLLADDGITFEGAMVHARSRLLSDLTDVRLPGGHHVHMDSPNAVASHVGPFLRDHA